MVVDDDDLVRRYAALVLEAAGYDVISFAGMKDALEALKNGTHPDVLLTDVLLDGHENGFHLARLARVILPDLKVLFASGYTDPQYFDEAPEDIVFLPKPYSRQSCLQAISEILAASR